MNNLTVLYIGGFELPDKNAAAQRVITNSKIFRSLGYTVYLVSMDKSLERDIPLTNQGYIYQGFTYYKVKYPSSYKNWLIQLTSIKNIISLDYIKPSHIIAYNYPSIALYRLKKYCSKNGIFLIADCTEWYEANSGNLLFRLLKKLDVFFRMNILHKEIDGLIVISKYLYDYYKLKIKNIIQLPPLVDLSMDKWRNNSALEERPVFSLVYAGSPGAGQKDRIDKIIIALSKIKELNQIQFQFKIIGITKESYLKYYGKKSYPSNIYENVLFKGIVSHNEALIEIRNADFAIFLRDENLTNKSGFPTKFVESISCGTPVITNISSNVCDFLESGKNGIMIDTSSEENLTRTLYNAMIIDRATITKMKTYCKSSSLFDYSNYLKQFKIFLDKVEQINKKIE